MKTAKVKAVKVKAVKAKVAKGAKAKLKKGSGSRGAMIPTSALSGKVWGLEVARERIFASPFNFRKMFDEEGLRELGENMGRVGQAHPLLVRPREECLARRLKSLRNRSEHQLEKKEATELGVVEVLAGQEVLAGTGPSEEEVAEVLRAAWMEFEIVAGERRWRAAGKEYGNLKTLRVEVRVLAPEEAIEFMAVENLQRRDLGAMERAEGLAALKAQGWTVERMCERFGIARTQVFEGLKLAKLEGPAKAALLEGRISPSVAALVAQVPDKKEQAKMVSPSSSVCFDYSGQPNSVRVVQAAIERMYLRGIDWDLKGTYEHGSAVTAACGGCAKNTRNMTEENPELAKGPARCFLGAQCYEERVELVKLAKSKELAAEAVELAKELRTVVLSAEESRRVSWDDEYLKGNEEVDGFTAKGDLISVPVEKLVRKAKGKVKAHGVAMIDDKAVEVYKRADFAAAGVALPLADAPSKDEKVNAEREASRKQEALRQKFIAAARRLGAAKLAELADAEWIRMMLLREVTNGGAMTANGEDITEESDISGWSGEQLKGSLAQSVVMDRYWDMRTEKIPYWASAVGLTLDEVLKAVRDEEKMKELVEA